MPEIEGKYIVIEGMDASGKTTQSAKLADHLTDVGFETTVVREPGGTGAGDLIRRILLDGEINLQAISEFDLFTVARRELIAQQVNPSITIGKTVISDRNWFSSMAYQGFGRGVSREYIIERSREALGDLFLPSHIVIIDVPIELVKERLGTKDGSLSDRFEREHSDFYKKVAEGYHWLSDKFDVPLIDGSQSIEQVHTEILSILGFSN